MRPPSWAPRFLAAAMVCGFIVAYTAEHPASQDGKATLAGRTSDGSGQAMSGVLVKAQLGQATHIVLSQRDGTFSFSTLPPGTYRVRAERRGFAAPPQEVTLPSSTPLSFALKPGTVDRNDLSGADLEQLLPDNPYKARLLGCEICHSWSGLTTRKRYRADTWLFGMRTMVAKRIASIDSNDMQPMAEYLHANLGPDAALPLNRLPPDRVDERALNIRYLTFDIPTANAMPHTAAPDHKGNVWFAEFGGGKIGVVNVGTGRMQEFAISEGLKDHPSPRPHGLTVDRSGIVWFTEAGAGRIGRFDPKTNTFKHYPIPPASRRAATPRSTRPTSSEADGTVAEVVPAHTLVVDAAGDIWFTSLRGEPIRRLNPTTGAFTEYVIREGGAGLYGITIDPATGRVWYAGLEINEVGYIEPGSGQITRFAIPTPNSGPRRLHLDAKGVAWFNLYNVSKIGRADPATGTVTEWTLPGPRNGRPYPLGVDAKGRVWTQTYHDDFLHMFDPKTEQFTTYLMPNRGLGLRDFFIDEKGWLWAGVFGRNQVIGFALDE